MDLIFFFPTVIIFACSETSHNETIQYIWYLRLLSFTQHDVTELHLCCCICPFSCLHMEKAMAPHSSVFAWRIPGTEDLVGCSPWGREESDTTERLHFHFSLSCIGEGNGNPLRCSCLENPRDRGAWWAAIYGVAQGRTQLKRLSSSSSMPA